MMKLNTDRLPTFLDDGQSQDALAQQLNKHLDSLGCFIVRSCLEPMLVELVHASLEKLFSKAELEKTKYKVDKLKDPLGAGFSPYGVARAMDTGIPNLLETWDINASRDRWPEDMVEEWRLFMQYQQTLYEWGVIALALIAAAIGVDRRDLIQLVGAENGGIHLIHYFPVPPESVHGARRQSEHCDNTLITLIPPPSPISAGITVYDRNRNTWEEIVINKDECLVQAGLLLERITCRTIRANLHTVRNPTFGAKDNVSRFSTPFFLSPSKEVLLKLLPKFRSDAALREFPDMRVSDIQAAYFSKIFRVDRVCSRSTQKQST